MINKIGIFSFGFVIGMYITTLVRDFIEGFDFIGFVIGTISIIITLGIIYLFCPEKKKKK